MSFFPSPLNLNLTEDTHGRNLTCRWVGSAVALDFVPDSVCES